MKRIISLLLSIGILLSITAGLETNAFAAETTNQQMVALLPVTLEAGEPALANIKCCDENGVPVFGYQIYVCHEENTDNEIYQDMLRQTNELIADKQSTYDKVEAIMKWVHKNMTYKFGSFATNNMSSVYYTYVYRYGNCMCYTQLANYMYYLAGIPSATIDVFGHEYSGVLIDGKWYKVDATNNIMTDNFDDGNQIEVICFTLPEGLTMVVDDLSGVKLTGTRYFLYDNPPSTITVPGYVNSSFIDFFIGEDDYSIIYEDGDKPEYAIETVNGVRGSGFENWLKQYYKCFTYQGDKFSAKEMHKYKAKNVIRKPNQKSEVVYTCTQCGDHYSVNASGWKKNDGKWLYFVNGYRKTGWLKIHDYEWYYLNSNGEMQTGWQKINNKWYYFHENGQMEQSYATVKGKTYFFNSDGTMITGWYQLPFVDYWFYFTPSGARAENCWQKVKGKWYHFDSGGAMQTGWKKISGDWYYFQSSGAMKTGWLKVGGKWYYLQQSGAMRTASLYYKGKTYYFYSNGVCKNP